MVVRGSLARGRDSGAQEEVAAGDLLQEVGEIVADGDGTAKFDRGLADGLDGCPANHIGHCRVVDDRRASVEELVFDLTAQSRTHRPGKLFDATQEAPAQALLGGADGST